jgi:hypothetical protein
VIHTSGTIVHPQIRASTSKTVAGTSVGFSATFTEGSPPPGATYAWSFGDGTTATGPDPTHTWKNSGTYSVNLDTGASDGSEGSATPVRVQVGAKPKPPPKAPPTKAPGTGTGPKHHTVTGPTTGTGTTSNGTTTDSGSSVLGGATTSTPGTTLGSVTPSTPTTTTPSEVSGTGTEVLPEGTPVDGILLVSDATASAATAPKAAPVPAASARAVPRLRWDRGLLWLLVFPVLLAAGGFTQTRWWVRRLPTLPWRTG